MKYYIANLQHRIGQDDHRFVFKFAADNSTDMDKLQSTIEQLTRSFSHLNVVASEVCQIQFETFRVLPRFIPDLAIPEPPKLPAAWPTPMDD